MPYVFLMLKIINLGGNLRRERAWFALSLLLLFLLQACGDSGSTKLPIVLIQAEKESPETKKKEGQIALDYQGLKQKNKLVFWERGNFSRRFPKKILGY